MEILENPGKIQKEARRGQEEARRGQEEARRGPEKPEKGQKRPGRGQKRPQKSQESRIWRKTARNAMCYEQKMTSLAASENWRKGRIEKQAKKRPGRGQKRPGRGQEEARRSQEEARRGPKRPGRGKGQRVENIRKKGTTRPIGEKLLETQ